MLRTLVLSTMLAALALAASGQSLGVLHIRVVVRNTDQQDTPVSGHALLISDNPSTAVPRRVVTRADGTVDVNLRAGSYTVESDRPLAFERQSYQWTETLTVAAGADVVLDLTAANAEIAPLDASAAPDAAPMETDPRHRILPFETSVVGLWTPTLRLSGFLVDQRGLIATSQRAVGNATSIEVELSRTIKVAGIVVRSDAAGEVALVKVGAEAVSSLQPIPMECGANQAGALLEGDRLLTLAAPLRSLQRLASGRVDRVTGQVVVSDFILSDGSVGGPVFDADGHLAGLTAPAEATDDRRREQFQVVRRASVCDALASVAAVSDSATAPGDVHLPVEPAKAFPSAALTAAVGRGASNRRAYQFSSSDFDIALITPPLVYEAQQARARSSGRTNSRELNSPDALMEDRTFAEFGNWTSYVADLPPVLLVRATPKGVEGFWRSLARGAALTQGVALPAMKHAKTGFSSMRVFCGATEVTPIHPFLIELPVSTDDALYEGLYAFDPGALGPHCDSVKLVLHSQERPDKGDTRTIDPAMVRRVWQDFAPWRETP